MVWFSAFTFADNTGDDINTITGNEVSNENLPQILIDTGTNTIYISGYINTWENLSWSNGNTWGEEVTLNTEPKDMETEFAEALAWMYENGLTKYDNKEDYRMFDPVSRQEASKIIWQAYITMWYDSNVNKNSNCSFSDSIQFEPTLAPHIANVCQWWLFKWAEGKYMPLNTLTKAEAMAVLIRMLEWKLSYELQIPRWEQYYNKWKLIGLTNIDDINKFDKPLERYEIWLMVYRLKNIVANEKLKNIALELLWQVPVPNSSGSMNPNIAIENANTLFGGIDPYKDPELLEAIYWMYDNGLTMYKNPNDYKPFDFLNKIAAAKIFDKFSDMLWIPSNGDPAQCEFSDISKLNEIDKQHIKNICKKWIMKWNNNKFSPDEQLHKSHFVVSLIRMLQWKHLDENVNPRWQNYFYEAKELWIVNPSDAISFEEPITRYEVALFLYRFNVKYTILNNLNNNRISNEIISTVDGTISTGTNWKLKSNVYIDSTLFKKWTFDIGYIETFGERYKIVKSSESNRVSSDSFVWHGSIFDMSNDEEIGTINFIISNGFVVESTIRFTDWDTYEISQIDWTSAYYLLKTL